VKPIDPKNQPIENGLAARCLAIPTIEPRHERDINMIIDQL
jgi:hypothetical protein